MLSEIEIFSTLDSDKPTGGNRSFGSIMGELVLITEYPCPSEEVGTSMLARHLCAIEPLEDSVIFESRGAVIAESGGLRSVIVFPEGGFLSSLLHSDVNLGWYFRLKIAVDVCRGLVALHDLDRIHNDLRPSTLGLDAEWHCKFLELVCIECVDDVFSPYPLSVGIRGDVVYMAPEVLQNGSCTAASDMYSFGLVLFELCARVPVHGIPRDHDSHHVNVEELLECLPESTPSSLVELIRQLLSEEAEYRPHVEDAMDWLDSLMMETSPADDPVDPPLPPLPFLQKRNSSRRSGGVSSKSLGGKLAISPVNAQRLREIADAERASKAQDGGAASISTTQRKFFGPQDTLDEVDDEEEATVRESSMAAPSSVEPGKDVIIGEPFEGEDPDELKSYIQLKAHNLPIYKNKYFFFKSGHLVWCSDKKLCESPERLHYFDLTCARVDPQHSSGTSMCLTKIRHEEDSGVAAGVAKGSGIKKNFFASSSKDRDKLHLRFSSSKSADKWRQHMEVEMSRARCQMCKSHLVLTREQLFQRERFRLLKADDNSAIADSAELTIFCSLPCYRFKSQADMKGMGMSTTAEGVSQLCLSSHEIKKIDKKMVSRRNPAAWRRMSRKHGVTGHHGHRGDKHLSETEIIELPTSVKKWLTSLDLSDLVEVFKAHDYTDIIHIMIASLCEEDMEFLGIVSKDTRRVLIDGAEKLRNNYVRNMQMMAAAKEAEIC